MLYLLRHGIALDCGQDGIRHDSERPLSAKGRERTELSAKGLLRLEAIPDVIATSPLLRARQTADIVASILAPDLSVHVTEALTPLAHPATTVAWLTEAADADTMLVGHMPNLADLAGLLLGGDRLVDISLKKASVCCLSCHGTWRSGGARLEWLLSPRQLRLLARCGNE